MYNIQSVQNTVVRRDVIDQHHHLISSAVDPLLTESQTFLAICYLHRPEGLKYKQTNKQTKIVPPDPVFM